MNNHVYAGLVVGEQEHKRQEIKRNKKKQKKGKQGQFWEHKITGNRQWALTTRYDEKQASHGYICGENVYICGQI